MPKGGARKGAGRKPKSLSEKLATGNPGKRPLKKLDIPGSSERPKPPDYLRMTESDFLEHPSATEFFEQIVDWLETTGCLHMIQPGLIEHYALAKFFLIQAAYGLSKTAVVVKNLKKEPVVSSFAKGFFDCAKTTNEMWDRIWQVVRDNSEVAVKNPETDFIALVSSNRMRRTPKAGGDADERYDGDQDSGFQAEPGEV